MLVIRRYSVCHPARSESANAERHDCGRELERIWHSPEHVHQNTRHTLPPLAPRKPSCRPPRARPLASCARWRRRWRRRPCGAGRRRRRRLWTPLGASRWTAWCLTRQAPAAPRSQQQQKQPGERPPAPISAATARPLVERASSAQCEARKRPRAARASVTAAAAAAAAADQALLDRRDQGHHEQDRPRPPGARPAPLSARPARLPPPACPAQTLSARERDGTGSVESPHGREPGRGEGRG